MHSNDDKTVAKVDGGRRDFVKKMAYVPPAIVTLKAAPAYAQKGSGKHGHPKPHKPKKPG